MTGVSSSNVPYLCTSKFSLVCHHGIPISITITMRRFFFCILYILWLLRKLGNRQDSFTSHKSHHKNICVAWQNLHQLYHCSFLHSMASSMWWFHLLRQYGSGLDSSTQAEAINIACWIIVGGATATSPLEHKALEKSKFSVSDAASQLVLSCLFTTANS